MIKMVLSMSWQIHIAIHEEFITVVFDYSQLAGVSPSLSLFQSIKWAVSVSPLSQRPERT